MRGASAARGVLAQTATLAFAVALMSGVAVAQPKSTNIGQVGQWYIYFSELDGGVEICSLVRQYPSGEWVHFDRVGNAGDLLTVYAPDAPSLESSQVVPVSLTFRIRGRTETVEIENPGQPYFTRGNNGMLVQVDPEIVRSLRAGSRFSISYEGYTSSMLALDGSSRSLDEIEVCERDRL